MVSRARTFAIRRQSQFKIKVRRQIKILSSPKYWGKRLFTPLQGALLEADHVTDTPGGREAHSDHAHPRRRPLGGTTLRHLRSALSPIPLVLGTGKGTVLGCASGPPRTRVRRRGPYERPSSRTVRGTLLEDRARAVLDGLRTPPALRGVGRASRGQRRTSQGPPTPRRGSALGTARGTVDTVLGTVLGAAIGSALGSV